MRCADSMQVVIKDETIWCTQKAMVQLFGVGVPAVSKHLKNIFEEGKLSQEITISKMETVISEANEEKSMAFVPRARSRHEKIISLHVVFESRHT